MKVIKDKWRDDKLRLQISFLLDERSSKLTLNQLRAFTGMRDWPRDYSEKQAEWIESVYERVQLEEDEGSLGEQLRALSSENRRPSKKRARPAKRESNVVDFGEARRRLRSK